MNMHSPHTEPQELPANIEVEQMLLGSCMMHSEAFNRLSDLSPEKFFEPIHREIFRATGQLIEQGKEPNPVLVKNLLPDQMIGNDTMAQYLTKLTVNAATAIEIPSYQSVVNSAYHRRQALEVADLIQHRTHAADLASDLALLEEYESLFSRFQGIISELSGKAGNGERAGDAYLSDLTERLQRGDPVGVPLPFPELRYILSESVLEAGNLYGLLSGSGEGKTSFTLQIIYHALVNGHPVLFLSYDQSQQQCVRQIAAQQLGIEARRQRDARQCLSPQEIDQLSSFALEFNELPFEFIKCNRETVEQLGMYCRPFINRHKGGKVPLIVLDHVRKVVPYSERAHEGRIAGHTNAFLKALAGEHHCVVMPLNQRNSKGMQRRNPRPAVIDLFGGEQAREDYDGIFYLYREEKHLQDRIRVAETKDERDNLEARLFQVQGKAEIGTLKARFGTPNQEEFLGWEGRFTRLFSMNQSRQGALV